jgi:hypothetical protein
MGDGLLVCKCQGFAIELARTSGHRTGEYTRASTSQQPIDLPCQYSSNPPRFRTVKNLFAVIDKDLQSFGAPDWHHEEVTLAEAPLDNVPMMYRCLEETGDFLIGTPSFSGKIAFAPEVRMNKDESMRFFSDMHTVDAFHKQQVSASFIVSKQGELTDELVETWSWRD